jgi:transglutaminase-like putative cysteine protease
MYYNIRHVTRFRYNAPISESIMEVRIQPRTEETQHCLEFHLFTNPRARILEYRGDQGNRVHHFDIPNRHTQLTVTAESLVELTDSSTLPERLPSTAWKELDALTATGEYWDMLQPSYFASPTTLLHELAQELHVERGIDPLTTLLALNTALHDAISYAPQNTRVDSPIDDALSQRRGVCQDFAHIMIALVRMLGIPCRYVSGYLYHRGTHRDRSSESATHAWVEALLPSLGWIGFDPTNDMLAGDRHIRVAIGRDYADVPPTRGVFRGNAGSELMVTVKVTRLDSLPTVYEAPLPDEELQGGISSSDEPETTQHQSQQAQQPPKQQPQQQQQLPLREE